MIRRNTVGRRKADVLFESLQAGLTREYLVLVHVRSGSRADLHTHIDTEYMYRTERPVTTDETIERTPRRNASTHGRRRGMSQCRHNGTED